MSAVPGDFIDEFVPQGLSVRETHDVDLGSDGLLYVAHDRQVSRFDPGTGDFIDLFIGQGDYPSGELLGIGQDIEFGNNGILYAAGGGGVHRFDGMTGAWIDEFIPEGSVAFANGSLEIGPGGNLYLGTNQCNCPELPSHIQRFDGATGQFMDEFVADGAGGLYQAIDLEFGPDGDLYVLSRGTSQVLKYDGVTGAFKASVLSVGLPEKLSLTLDEAGNLYVGGSNLLAADTGRIVRAQFPDYASTAQQFVVSNAVEVWASTVSTNGELFMATRDATVLKYDAASMQPQETFEFPQLPPWTLDSPHGVTFGPDGMLYVANNRGDSVIRYDGSTGELVDEFVSPGSGGLDSPFGMVFGPDGNLYVASLQNDQVLRYDGLNGEFIDVFAEGGTLNTPTFLIFNPEHDLLVSSALSDEVLRYDGGTGLLEGSLVSSGSGGLDAPTGLSFGANGDLYVSSNGTDEILRFNGTTGAPLGAFVSAANGGLDSPYGVSWGPDGNLYVASFRSDEILRYDGTTGSFIDSFARDGGFRTFDRFADIAFGLDGNLYASDSGNDRVVRFAGPLTATADFNADLLVNGRDFLIWQRGVGTLTGATIADGDADRDGVVDGDDLREWQSRFGQDFTPPPPEPVDLVLNNDQGAPAYSETGSWTTSDATGYEGSTYRFAPVGNAATASWQFELEQQATGEVFAYYRTDSNRATSAAYRVETVAGEETVLINQTTSGVEWVSLGVFEFDAGVRRVTLDAGLSSGGTWVIADAVRVVIPPETLDIVAAAGASSGSEGAMLESLIAPNWSLDGIPNLNPIIREQETEEQGINRSDSASIAVAFDAALDDFDQHPRYRADYSDSDRHSIRLRTPRANAVLDDTFRLFMTTADWKRPLLEQPTR
ncbi:hypothetical protein OAS39_07415 [Pirellulales bacterium]|nr:hypothetical protein [Pirellulales bacterium]